MDTQPVAATTAPVVGPPRQFEAPAAATPIRDTQVEPALHEVASDPRRLGSPKSETWSIPSGGEQPGDARSLLPKLGLPLDSIYTTGTALAIVMGLFLLCIWALRRGGGRKATSLLPQDAVCVLGRVQLAARQFAQLIHCGNKLVLLSVTPNGAETLTEITDPAEVDRLLGVCMQGKSHSSTSEFDEVFRKLAAETGPDDLADRAALRPGMRPAADAYAAYRGSAQRG